MRLRALLLLGMTALAACDAAQTPTLASAPPAPRQTINHWPHWGIPGFYFLPATPPAGATENPFDANLSPTVRICRITNGACGTTLATFTRTSGSYGRLVTASTSARTYSVTWPTASTGVSAGQTYRATVQVSGRDLGFMEIRVVANAAQAAAVDTSEYRAVVAGAQLPITFRINQGIPGSISLSASSLSVGVGDGKAFPAQVLDLHGQPLSMEIYTEVENTSATAGPVAELDSGLVVGRLPGTARIWAVVEDIVVQLPVTVTDTRRAWTGMTTPDDQGNRAVWGPAGNNLFTANHTGVLRFNGSAWSHVEAVRWRSMYDVLGFSANDVWAVGENGMILRFNGSTWSASRFNGTSVAPYSLTTWDLPGAKVTLRALWGIAPSIMAAVGDGGTALYYDGTQWIPVPTGVTANLTDVWGSGPTDIYATTSAGTLLRFNGSSISTVAGVQAPGAMNAVWGSSASNVYAVGAKGMLFRYNGSSWQRIRLPTRADLYTVWGTSASNVFVGGADGALYRWDGTRWTPEKTPRPDAQIYGFWGTGSDVFAAGAGGLMAKR